jgi:hypothetical protein
MSKDILKLISDRNKRFEYRYGDPKSNQQPVSEMSMRDMLALTRPKLNENDQPRQITQAEIDREHEKMLNYFAEDEVDIQFQDFLVKPDAVFMSGKIGDGILFAYQVSPSAMSQEQGCRIEYLDGFDPSNPDNDRLIKKVQAYWGDFFKYWRDNELQLDGI